MARALHLTAADYALELEPVEGGAVARFDWCGEPLFRARCGDGPLNSACFPLVPFSNRIAFGAFDANGRRVVLKPNFPGMTHPHPLHGFGWLMPWRVEEATAASATLRYTHESGEWPWRFEAEQRFDLSAAGFRHELALRNLSDMPMPAGLGFHPYFPRAGTTRYIGKHRGEWETSADGLPIHLERAHAPRDWWDGAAVGARVVDTVFIGRDGRLGIEWPERSLSLTISPSPELSFTVVYTPRGGGFLLCRAGVARDGRHKPFRRRYRPALARAR